MTHVHSSVSRRVMLGGLGAGAMALAAAESATAAPLTGAPSGPKRWTGARSENGWLIGGKTRELPIEGTQFSVTLAVGPTAALLQHAARRINYELDTLRAGDITGVTSDRVVASPQRSNLLSGTAIHFRPGFFPHGTSGNLFPAEVVVIEDIVAESGGVLAWGGHLEVPDQGLIYVSGSAGTRAVDMLTEDFSEADRMDSAGGAGAIDAHDPSRRNVARRHRERVS
ncbi:MULTISPECIES: hypothetical protein [unclassified Knoellia]|uniref:hypothetical protein n=1 Tax=Knoellia altitudinis TaxID=3404795 RepID=UPI003607857F